MGRVGVSLSGGLRKREGAPGENASANAGIPYAFQGLSPTTGDPGSALPSHNQVFATVDGAAPDAQGQLAPPRPCRHCSSTVTNEGQRCWGSQGHLDDKNILKIS